MASFKLLTWCHLAHKSPENLTTQYKPVTACTELCQSFYGQLIISGRIKQECILYPPTFTCNPHFFLIYCLVLLVELDAYPPSIANRKVQMTLFQYHEIQAAQKEICSYYKVTAKKKYYLQINLFKNQNIFGRQPQLIYLLVSM